MADESVHVLEAIDATLGHELSVQTKDVGAALTSSGNPLTQDTSRLSLAGHRTRDLAKTNQPSIGTEMGRKIVARSVNEQDVEADAAGGSRRNRAAAGRIFRGYGCKSLHMLRTVEMDVQWVPFP